MRSSAACSASLVLALVFSLVARANDAPGGETLTIASLLENTVGAAERRLGG